MFRFAKLTTAALIYCVLATSAHARLVTDAAPGAQDFSASGFSVKPRAPKTIRQKSHSKIKIEPRQKVGYVIELLVQCPQASKLAPVTGIITFSMIDKQFCQPNQRCHGTAQTAAAHVCKANRFQSSEKR